MERFRHLLVTTAGQIRLACKESSNPDLADCVQEHPILALPSGCQCCVQGMCEFRRCLNPDLKTQTLFCPFCPMSVSPTPPDHPNPHQSTAYTMAPSHSKCYESTGPRPVWQNQFFPDWYQGSQQRSTSIALPQSPCATFRDTTRTSGCDETSKEPIWHA